MTGNDNRQEEVGSQEEDSSQEEDTSQDEDSSQEQDDNINDECILKYKCDKCDLSFKFKSWFMRHTKIHDPASIPCE